MKEYWDVWDVFSKTGFNALLPHHHRDCSIEILPGARLPKPKLYLMTPCELEELHVFIDKNLKHGFIQPVRPLVVVLVSFQEKKDGTLCLYVDYREG